MTILETSLLTPIRQGSVKDIYAMKEQSTYLFHYSDRYSIFDWGEMPDHLPHKGEALCYMADFFFDEVEKLGVRHHSLGRNPSNAQELLVRPVYVPSIDECQIYNSTPRPTNILVPLEVIFRFGLPLGSSLPKRLRQNPEYAKEIGINENDSSWEVPIIEFSTKLESYDRYLTPQEAKAIAGLSETEMTQLKSLTQKLAIHLKQIFLQTGLTLWDGKFEFAFDENREFMLVDSIGPDELRLTYHEIPFSKEYLRQFYHDSAWAKEIQNAKAKSKESESDWKKIVTDEWKLFPAPLTDEALKCGSWIYTTIANALALSREQHPPFNGPQTVKELFNILSN